MEIIRDKLDPRVGRRVGGVQMGWGSEGQGEGLFALDPCCCCYCFWRTQLECRMSKNK